MKQCVGFKIAANAKQTNNTNELTNERTVSSFKKWTGKSQSVAFIITNPRKSYYGQQHAIGSAAVAEMWGDGKWTWTRSIQIARASVSRYNSCHCTYFTLYLLLLSLLHAIRFVSFPSLSFILATRKSCPEWWRRLQPICFCSLLFALCHLTSLLCDIPFFFAVIFLFCFFLMLSLLLVVGWFFFVFFLSYCNLTLVFVLDRPNIDGHVFQHVRCVSFPCCSDKCITKRFQKSQKPLDILYRISMISSIRFAALLLTVY